MSEDENTELRKKQNKKKKQKKKKKKTSRDLISPWRVGPNLLTHRCQNFVHVRKVVGSKCVCIKGGAFKSYYNTIILLFHLRYYKRERGRERERERERERDYQCIKIEQRQSVPNESWR